MSPGEMVYKAYYEAVDYKGLTWGDLEKREKVAWEYVAQEFLEKWLAQKRNELEVESGLAVREICKIL